MGKLKNLLIETEEEREVFERMQAQPSREQLIAEVAVLTELVRVLSDRVKELEGKHETDPRVFGRVSHVYGNHPISFGLPQQRTWVGLTDEEQQQAYEQWQNDGWGVFYNAIETKLKEKNT
jgi:hypothetical protein